MRSPIKKNILNKLFNSFFKHKSSNIYIQFFRYFIVSGIALVVDLTLTYSLTEFLKIYYLASSIIGNFVGLIINYILNILWVFNKRKIKNKKIEFLLFVLTSFIGMFISQFAVWFFTEIVKLYYMISKVISVFFGYFARFFLRKFLLF